MTVEEVNNVLRSYLKLSRMVKIKREQLDWAQKDMGSLSGIDYSKEIHSGGNVQSVVERAVERVDRIEQEYIALCERLFKVEDCIASFLPLLTDDEQIIIIERYMHGADVRFLARKLCYSEKHVYKKLRQISLKIKEDTKWIPNDTFVVL